MKHCVPYFQTSNYKYNIIARLLSLDGAESSLTRNKKHLIEYMIQKGFKESTVRNWLVIDKITQTEIPVKALREFAKYFNIRLARRYERGHLESTGPFTKITIEDLFHSSSN